MAAVTAAISESLTRSEVQLLERELAQEGMEYMLRMYWLGRSDKIPTQLAPVLLWATEAWTDVGTGKAAAGYARGRILFEGRDHVALSKEVARNAAEWMRTGA